MKADSSDVVLTTRAGLKWDRDLFSLSNSGHEVPEKGMASCPATEDAGLKDLSDTSIKLCVRISQKVYSQLVNEVERKKYASISSLTRRLIEKGLNEVRP
jgi:hypothetical protein